MIKKIYAYMFAIMIGMLTYSNLTYAQDFFYDMGDGAYELDDYAGGDTTEIGKIINDDSIRSQGDQEAGILSNLMKTFRLSTSAWFQNEPTERKAIAYVQMIMNILLGLVSFISLILMIYAFFLMFFTEQEEGKTKAKKIFIGIGIALFVMGLSRFIVSFIFNIYSTVATGG